MTQTRAILCAVVAYFGWVLVDVVTKLGAQSALSPFAMMGVFGMIGALSVTGVALGRRNVATLRPRSPRIQLLIALCSLVISYANVIALKHLPLTVFYVAVFTSPLAIALLATLLKHETLTKMKVTCLLLGALGVGIAIAPRLQIGGEGIGYLAALISVLCFAVYTVMINKISATDSPSSILFLNCFLRGIVGFAVSFSEIAAADRKMLALLVGAGLINIVMDALYNKSLYHTSSTNVAQLHYTQIIWGAVLGYVIWQDVPSWNLYAGASLIIAAGVAVARRARKEDVLAASVPP